MNLPILLNNSIEELDGLINYYESQLKCINERISEESEKYKYSVALNSFFAIQMLKALAQDKKIEMPKELNSYEQSELVEEVLEKFNFVKDNDYNSWKISYVLKKSADGLGDRYELNPKKGTREYENLKEQPYILGKTTLMMIIINYEETISQLFKYLIRKFPSAYLSEKTVTYSEIISLESDIKDIKNFFVNAEVEALMRLPLSNWYALFEKKHKTKFWFNNNEFDIFKEVYYRRNILVHNNGIVNKTYFDNVPHNLRSDVKIGDTLIADVQYIRNASNITQKIIYGTFWGLRRISEDAKELSDKFFNIGFEHMKNGNWELSEFIFSNLKEDKEQESCEITACLINYWISIKNQGRLEQIREDIIKFDVSAMSGEFKVAKYALLDDFQKVSECLELVVGRELSTLYIDTWPLFIQYRTSQEYFTFRDEHKEIFKVKEFEAEQDQVENDRDEINLAV